ncbi:type II toxin-antitoxin system RelE/ParE family toxin [Desulfonatronum parangueonense]
MYVPFLHHKMDFHEKPGLDDFSVLVEGLRMAWSVIFCDEFDEEFGAMPEGLQDTIYSNVGLLEIEGPSLGRPWVETLEGSAFKNMKELRFSWNKGIWRIAFAFDPQRNAVLLVAADKRGTNQRLFYRNLVRQADDRYQRHLGKIAEANHGENS